MSLDDRAPPRPDRAAPEQDTAERGAIDLWPIDPDPGLTSLADRQFWQFNDGAPVSVEVAGIRIDAGDARIADLGIRRDARARQAGAGANERRTAADRAGVSYG